MEGHARAVNRREEKDVLTVQLNQEERQMLGPMVMEVLDDWQLNDEACLALLGLPEKTRARELTRYRHGNTPIPDDADVVERTRTIIGIQQALHLIFARNPNMPGFWLANRNNRQFGRAPMEVMLEEGLAGMQRVWGHLDCTQNW